MERYEKEIQKLVPPFFNLDNYIGTENLDVKGWNENLNARLYVSMKNLKTKEERRELNLLNLKNGSKAYYEYKLKMMPALVEVKDIENGSAIKTLWCSPPIVVSLSVPDKILISQFMQWVNDKRKEENINVSKPISKSAMRRWHDNRLLQYLDLVQWYWVNGLKPLSHGQAGQIIFPDDPRGGVNERIRQTVRPLAQGIIDNGLISALQSHESLFMDE